MKILVLSDSHGSLAAMQRAVQQFAPDCVLHLGDHWRDAQTLRAQLDGIPLFAAPGNCDPGVHAEATQLLCFEGVQIMMTHGHLYGVKMNTMRAEYRALEAGAQVLVFGHTHRAMCQRHSDLWVLNPGSCGSFRPTCGLLICENGAAHCELHEIGGIEYDSGN